MLTPTEQLRFYAENAVQSMAFAETQAAAGEPLALFNFGGASESHLMRALIGWRSGMLSPAVGIRPR